MPGAGSLAAFMGLVRSWTVEKNPLPPLFYVSIISICMLNPYPYTHRQAELH